MNRLAKSYYNENDPFAAKWLENLIEGGHIDDGIVDTRSIVDVTPKDLKGFTQCHFFAGIGGWSLALRLADWPDSRPVWTGSCPCQPFSVSGKNKGFEDERHLWPAWFYLIQKCRPATIFGEQVTSPAAMRWLDIVASDLETMGYAFGSLSIPACSVAAPHIRQRAWFVGDSRRERLEKQLFDKGIQKEKVAHGERQAVERASWATDSYVRCNDGKLRPIEPGTFPLANGIPNRVGRLRAYGNAIVPQVAAKFIKSVMVK